MRDMAWTRAAGKTGDYINLHVNRDRPPRVMAGMQRTHGAPIDRRRWRVA